MSYPTISLFSGAMGLDLGLMKAGLDVRISQDIDPWCGKTMEANNHPHIIGDIKKMVQEDPSCSFLTEPAKIAEGECFAIVGGPPCQSFSTAGKRKGFDDPRGSLFMEFVHTVKTIKPRFFVMENVKGLLSTPVSEDVNEKKFAIDVILESFHAIGYKTVWGVLNSVNYGVPQFRERLIIIGSRDNENIFLPNPTHFQTHQNEEYRWKTLEYAFKDIDNTLNDCAQFSEKRAKFLPYIPMGGNWKDLSEEMQKEAMGGAFNSGGGKTGFYRRLNLYEPSPTLVTSPIQKASMLIHPTENRPLSTKEYARIQQFPDDWNIEGKTTDVYRQIGNAVPVGLANAIGDTLISIANETQTIHSKRIKINHYQKALEDITNKGNF